MINDKGQINIILKNKEMKLGKKHPKLQAGPLTKIDSYFENFIGLEAIKESVREIYATKLIDDERRKNGLKTEKQMLHMIFTGNPGTGKTTIARNIAHIFLQLNILSKGHFIEAERADLVGEYIGQTAQKTRQLIQRALGGVLFIDEAYSLARGGEKDFGREAIDTLVKYLEDYADEFVLILAGYPREMSYFLQMNPGLSSRFPFHHQFRDYSVDELLQIARQLAKERQYKLTEHAQWKLKRHLQKEVGKKDRHFANGRYVRNIIEKAIRAQAMRLITRPKLQYDDLIYLDAKDLP